MMSTATRVHGLHWLTLATGALAVTLASGAHANPRAQPEPSSLAAARPVTDPVEMGTWLARVTGRFRVEGAIMMVYAPHGKPVYPCITEDLRPTDYCTSIKGKADCVPVGKGPGVQCMFNVAWRDVYEIVQPVPSEGDTVNSDPVGVFSLPGGVSNLDPAMALFGLDPGISGLSYLLVDHKGLPEGGPGFIADHNAVFKTECVNAPALFNEMKPAPRDREEGPPRDCERTVRITAKPDGKLVQISEVIVINRESWTRIDLTFHRELQAAGAASAQPAAR